MNEKNDRVQGFPSNHRTSSGLLWIASIALIYFAAARVGLMLVIRPEGIAPVWLPGGIFLSALLLTRRTLRPFLVVVLCVVDFAAEMLAGTPLLVSALYALILSGEAVLSSWLMLRFVGATVTFDKSRDLVGFLLLAVLLSNGVTALLAAGASTLIPETSFWASWSSWSASDGIGNLLLTPFILSWASVVNTGESAWGTRRTGEGALLIILMVILNLLLFPSTSGSDLFSLLLPCSTFPFLFWAAFRFGIRGVTAVLVVLAAIVLPYAVGGSFSRLSLSGVSLNDVIVVQLYLAIMIVPSLLLGTAVTERERAVATVRESEARFRAIFEDSPIAIWEEDFSIVKTRLDNLRRSGVSDIRAYLEQNPGEVANLAACVRVIAMNRASAEMLGAASVDNVVLDLPHYFTPQSLDVFRDELIALAEGQMRFRCESLQLLVQGRQVILDLTLSVRPGYEETLSRVLVSFVDTTDRRRAEKALQDRDRYIETILENSPIGFAVNTISDGKGVFVGQKFEDIYGVARGGIRTVDEYFEKVYLDPEFREAIRARIMSDMATGDAARMRWEDIPITTAAGEHKFVTAINIPLPEQNLMISTVQDATARHRAEMALRESEERFRSFVEQAGDGFELLDREGRYLDANTATCRQLGYSREELLRLTIFDVDPLLTRERYASTFQSLVEHKSITFEATHRRKDGSTFPVEITTSVIRLSAELIALTLVRDITERKHAEETLRKSQQFTEILNRISKSFLTRTNEADMYDDVLQIVLEILGSPIGVFGYLNREGDLVCPSMTQGVWAQCNMRNKSIVFPANTWGESIWGRSLTSGKPQWTNRQLPVPEGHMLVDRCLSVPLLYQNRPIGLLLVANKSIDYSEEDLNLLQRIGEHIAPVLNAMLNHQWSEADREKLQNQLLQSQKLESIGQLAGGIAHDFNNVLGTIVGYGNLLQMKMQPDDPHREYANRILSSAERAAGLTRSLLAFSRQQVINPKLIDLNVCVRKIESFLSRIIGEDISLKVVLSEEPLMIFADATQIEQILMNLSTNARDAMPKGGTLVIGTDRTEVGTTHVVTHSFGVTGFYAVLSVADTGVGMDNRTLTKIFDPFFTTKEVGRGTGLGLAIVYGIVKQNHGHINVYSEIGTGTTFRIYLPLAPPSMESAYPEAAPISLKGGSETILLVEDDASMREMSREVLTDYGYTVIQAEDGEIGLQKFLDQADTIDLILTDVIMPRKNGRELFEEARKKKPDVKVLFMSGYPADLIEKVGPIDQGLHFMTKPSPPPILLQKIREVLDQRQ